MAALAPFCGLRDVEGIGAHAVADDLGENWSAPATGIFQLFQDEYACAFPNHEAITA